MCVCGDGYGNGRELEVKVEENNRSSSEDIRVERRSTAFGCRGGCGVCGQCGVARFEPCVVRGACAIARAHTCHTPHPCTACSLLTSHYRVAKAHFRSSCSILLVSTRIKASPAQASSTPTASPHQPRHPATLEASFSNRLLALPHPLTAHDGFLSLSSEQCSYADLSDRPRIAAQPMQRIPVPCIPVAST